MDINPQLALARDFLENTGTHIFLTGRAGTGKTTFLRRLSESSPKRMVVVAPTGVAAINAGGMTMHSFFQLPFGVWLPGMKHPEGEIKRFSKNKIAIIKSLDLLVIDEISMVRADLLDSVDEVLRRFRDRTKPFGGVQLLMIGDVQQLAPVIKDEEWELMRRHYRSPYFFDSVALRQTSYVSIELQHIYRQSDPGFIDLLAKVRDNALDRQALDTLNARYRPGFNPPQEEGYITLTSHNHTARGINDRRLDELTTPIYRYTAEVEGDFPEYLYPIDYTLTLKEGAQVMFTKNDHTPEKRYVNGTIGTITCLGDDYIEVQPASGGEPIDVRPDMWENTKYTIDPETREIAANIEGVFTQFPLKTAWAITIHKSQGLTFERAIIDAADSFSHGQVYVALSRCRTLEGIVLRTPLAQSSIISDATVGQFSDYVEQNQPSERELDTHKRTYYQHLLGELFDFGPLYHRYGDLVRLLQQNMWRTYPKLTERWMESEKKLKEEVMEVGLRFRAQIGRLMGDDYASDPVLAERVAKGAAYFLDQCGELTAPLQELSKTEIDNKETRKQFGEAVGRLAQALRIKLSTLLACQSGFEVQGYLKAKARAIADTETAPKEKFKTPKPAKQPKKSTAEQEEDDILCPELLEILCDWRGAIAKQHNMPAYVIATTRALIGVANAIPSDAQELRTVKGIGKVFIEKYGPDVLAIIEDFRAGRIGMPLGE